MLGDDEGFAVRIDVGVVLARGIAAVEEGVEGEGVEGERDVVELLVVVIVVVAGKERGEAKVWGGVVPVGGVVWRKAERASKSSWPSPPSPLYVVVSGGSCFNKTSSSTSAIVGGAAKRRLGSAGNVEYGSILLSARCSGFTFAGSSCTGPEIGRSSGSHSRVLSIEFWKDPPGVAKSIVVVANMAVGVFDRS